MRIIKNDFTEHILEYPIVPAAPVIYNVMVSLLLLASLHAVNGFSFLKVQLTVFNVHVQYSTCKQSNEKGTGGAG
jgi:hypothetical protein